MRRTLFVLAAVLLPAAVVAQQPFEWSGRMRDGATLKLFSSNGPIEVVAATGARARVHGEILESNRDRDPVRFQVVEDGDDIIVCALTERHVCEPDGIRRVDRDRWGRHGPERALMRVALPAGVDLVASSGNGRIRGRTDFRDFRATIGEGGRRLFIRSGNGDAVLRRR